MVSLERTAVAYDIRSFPAEIGHVGGENRNLVNHYAGNVIRNFHSVAGMVNHSVGAGVLGGSSFSVYASPPIRKRQQSRWLLWLRYLEVFSVPEAALLPQAASCSTMAVVNNAAVSFVFLSYFLL